MQPRGGVSNRLDDAAISAKDALQQVLAIPGDSESKDLAVAYDFAKLPEKEVVTLTTTQAAELIAAADADFDLLPYHAIGLFAGIRPMELQRLAWSDIDLREKHIHIRPEVSKTGRRRIVDMEPNLCAWLGGFIARGGDATGLVTPSVNLRKQLREVRSTAGVGDWHQDVMRHTYASNWLAQHGDINKLTLFMGHESTDMLWKHYHKATKQRDAVRYWKIKPAASDSRKIVSFAERA